MKKSIACALLFTAKVAMADIYVSAEALYWQTTETADWAFILESGPRFSRTTIKTLCFDWDPGFRVGLGFDGGCDCWDTSVTYTHFCTKTTNRATALQVQSEFLGPKLSEIGFFQEASIRAKLAYNFFDWELGRTLWVTPCLSLRPMIGLKGGWIDQTLDTFWSKTIDLIILEIPITATENLTQDFWGIGPQGGVNGNWYLSECWSIYGDVSGALMWGHWCFTDFYEDSIISRIRVEVPSRDFGAVMLRGALGLSFEVCPFAFKLGYEIQDWFNHYQVFDNGTGGHNNDLILQGLQFRVQIDF